MLRTLKTYLIYGKTYCGIEYTTQNDQEISCGLVLKNQKNELTKIKSLVLKNTEVELRNQKHVFLVINNHNVLSKTVSSASTNINDIAYQAFPNSNLNDFYFEILSHENRHFVALCRKDEVDKILKYYSLKGISILGLSLGNLNLQSLVSHINEKYVYTSNAKVSLKNGMVEDLELLQKVPSDLEFYKVNGIELRNSELLAFAVSLNFIYQSTTTKKNFNDVIKKEMNNFLGKRFFIWFYKIIGVAIFILLLVNFMLLSYFSKEANKLDSTIVNNTKNNTEFNIIKSQVEQKKKLIDQFSNKTTSKSAFYTHNILQELPTSILLLSCVYQPLKKKIQYGNLVEQHENYIKISGVSNENESFLKWIEHIESKNWVSLVEIIQFNNKTENSSDFTIGIKLKYETAKKK